MTPPSLRGARAAFVFMTRLPVGGFPYSPEDFSWAPAYFPLVGAAVGGLAAFVHRSLLPLGAGVAAVLALCTTALATGAFHEDGLADTFDALGGSHGRDRIFEILKDSRVGAFGATVLAFSLLLRASLLTELGGRAPLALVLSHTVARTGPVWLMSALPYVSGTGAKGAAVARGSGASRSVIATAVMLVVAGASLEAGATPGSVCCGVLGAVLVTALSGVWYRARAGGVTGDFLGATEQMAEVAVLLGILAHAKVTRGWS